MFRSSTITRELALNLPKVIFTLKQSVKLRRYLLCGGTVVKVLCYKSEGRWFDSRWCHWNFSLT